MAFSAERGAEDDEEDETILGSVKRVTPKVLKKLVKEQQLYNTPELNDKLYLHYHGFQCIEGLDAWTGLRALWLEGNGFAKIEGLEEWTRRAPSPKHSSRGSRGSSRRSSRHRWISPSSARKTTRAPPTGSGSPGS